MGVKDIAVLALTHPGDLRTLAQYWMYQDDRRDITARSEHTDTGYDRRSMRRCWELLDLTSRSFSAVIKELEGDLARVICLFYIVLRGLDTVEDDMTIPDEVKQPILRSFHQKVTTPGWNFTGSGPNEKDRAVLVDFADIVEEVGRLDPACRDVIVDICHKMEMGMADYAHHAAVSGEISLPTLADYDLYCHYVAGLVGEGLSGLFAATGKEAAWLAQELELSNSMGILLQKTNIIRDFREDAEERRFFWPRDVWADPKFGNGVAIDDVRELYAPGNEDRARWVQSAMIIDALRHATDSLDYLRLLRNQSVFKFAAIPAVMALATLDLCFMNYEMFKRNIKIRKAQAAHLVMKASNPRDVAYIFRDYARSIHAKASPRDPSFFKLSIAVGRIEMWAEHYYPSFVQIVDGASGARASFNPADPRSALGARIDAQVAEEAAQRKREESAAKYDAYRKERAERLARGEIAPPAPDSTAGMGMELALYVLSALALVGGVGAAVVYGVLYFFPVEGSYRI